MTFAAFESSVESSQPVELYEIVLGGLIFRYTSAEDDVIVSGITYTATPIKRSKIAQGPEVRNTTLDIEVPGTNLFVRKYISSVPGDRSRITIKRYQRSDPEVVTQFQGNVRNVSFSDDGHSAKIAIAPKISASSRTIPRYTFQSSCNNVLGDSRCKVNLNLAAFRLTAIVTAASANTITVPGAAAYGTGWFNAGDVEALGGTDARMILDQTGDVITMLLPFPFTIIGQSVTLLAGCGHTPTDCNTKFGNFNNYGAFAFTPLKNPFDSGIGPTKC